MTCWSEGPSNSITAVDHETELMSTNQDLAELTLRPALALRGVALALVALGCILAIAGRGVAAILIGVGFAVLGVGAFRMVVRVGPEGVLVNGGLRARRLAWVEIERFRWVSGWTNGGVYVLLATGEDVKFPGELTTSGTRSQRAKLCSELEALRAAYQAGPPPPVS